MSRVIWSKIIEENREKLVEKIVKTFKQAEGFDSSWHYDVEICEDGEIVIAGPMSQGSQTMATWEGERELVARIECWKVDINYDECLDWEDEKLEEEYNASEYEYVEDFIKVKHPSLVEEWEKVYIDDAVMWFRDGVDDIIEQRIKELKYEEAQIG